MNQAGPDLPEPRRRSAFSHYLPRLKRVFYQADAVVFWTLPVSYRQQGWLTDGFHAVFREMMLHAAAREGLLCPAYCLMGFGTTARIGTREEPASPPGNLVQTGRKRFK